MTCDWHAVMSHTPYPQVDCATELTTPSKKVLCCPCLEQSRKTITLTSSLEILCRKP